MDDGMKSFYTSVDDVIGAVLMYMAPDSAISRKAAPLRKQEQSSRMRGVRRGLERGLKGIV